MYIHYKPVTKWGPYTHSCVSTKWSKLQPAKTPEHAQRWPRGERWAVGHSNGNSPWKIHGKIWDLPSGYFLHSHGKSPFSIGKPSISMDHLYHGYVKYVSHNQRVPRIHPEITLKNPWGKSWDWWGIYPERTWRTLLYTREQEDHQMQKVAG